MTCNVQVKTPPKDVWGTAKPAVAWLARASFGIALLSSIAIVITGVTALSASKDSDSRGGSSMPMVPMRMWGPHPLDFLYYSRPYRPYAEPQELGFLQSCFSLLFGDGDPNADLAQRTSASAASLIRANGGAVHQLRGERGGAEEGG